MNSFDSEKEQLFELFLNSFERIKQIPMVLYGIGANTHHILKRVKGFNIIGLMDQENTGKEIYGLPVLSKQEVIKSAKNIVIIARPAVIPIILARITDLAERHKIDIYDISGKNLFLQEEEIAAADEKEWSNGEQQLRSAIDNADIISFDIFDTLLVRKVLRAQNVFDIIEKSLANKRCISVPFKTKRIQAEQIAAERYEAPGIEQIYTELMALLEISAQDNDMILQEEIASDKLFLTPRNKMLQLFGYALERGKTVYLISDMYFGKEHLSELLTTFGIAGYKGLLVSCDFGETKRSGRLFEHYLELEPTGTHLHIGDDVVADIEIPQKYGIETFHVKSCYEMLVGSRFSHLLSDVVSYSDAVALGLFVARAFNNPFALHETKGKLFIGNEFDIGYLGYGAILTGFMRWLMGLVQGQGDAKILFGARDGYLISRLYNIFVETFNLGQVPEGIYFLTSRRAVSVPSIQNRNDIEQIFKSIAGYPLYSEILYTKFGVICDTSDKQGSKKLDRDNMDDLRAFIFGFEKQIYDNAQTERLFYLEYARSLGISPQDKLYVYDLITSGTIPFYLGKILGKEIDCICFSVSAPLTYDLKGNQHSYLGMESPYNKMHNFPSNYYLNESIMTAPFPEFMRISESGEPIYSDSDDSHKYFDKVKMTHAGIEAYLCDFLKLIQHAEFEPITVKLADGINGIFKSIYCHVDENIKQNYMISDNSAFSPAVNSWGSIRNTSCKCENELKIPPLDGTISRTICGESLC